MKRDERMLKSIIVDDEILAIHLLEAMLKDNETVEIIGKFTSPLEAIDHIPRLKPDILFLDIEMADMNGIEVASKVEELAQSMDIIFITAYEHYAIEAFAVQAVDYILKPIEKMRLLKTIERIALRRKQIQLLDRKDEDISIIDNFHFHVSLY